MTEELAKTLTEKQQRKSLSGPKSAKKTVRNVLAKPYSGFWPLAGSLGESELQELLELLLPAASKPVTTEDRRILRNMQGKKMKEARGILQNTIWERNPDSKKHRENLSIGINEVSHALEDNTLASLLISNEADPPILTQHLASLAAGCNVPFVVLKNLKDYTKKGLRFSSLTLGFKNIVATEERNHFHPLHLKIVSVFKAIAETMIPRESQDGIVTTDVLRSPLLSSESVLNLRSPKEIHLIRDSKKSRVFVPGLKSERGNDSKWSQYISLSGGVSDKTSVQTLPSHREVLGSKSVIGAQSFLQRVSTPQEAIESKTSIPLLMSAVPTSSETQMEVETGLKVRSKPIKRYFSTLAPLKVKRIQGNPNKKKQKNLRK